MILNFIRCIYNAWEAYLSETKPQKDAGGATIPADANIDLYTCINETVRLSIKSYLKL